MNAEAEFLVICLCAEWCSSCRDYSPGFMTLAGEFPELHFQWIDIEDQADEVGDIDIENFPTLLLARNNLVLFYGSMLPVHEQLRRMIGNFFAQTPAESHALAFATTERRKWQKNPDLRRILAICRQKAARAHGISG